MLIVINYDSVCLFQIFYLKINKIYIIIKIFSTLKERVEQEQLPSASQTRLLPFEKKLILKNDV